MTTQFLTAKQVLLQGGTSLAALLPLSAALATVAMPGAIGWFARHGLNALIVRPGGALVPVLLARLQRETPP